MPGLPRDLELIALKCLAKEPAERYLTAGALADDLARFAAGEPVSVRAANPFERALKWARRKPTLAATYALTTTVVILLVFGTSLAVLWRSAERARATAETAKKAAEGDRSTAEVARKGAETAQQSEKEARANAEKAQAIAEKARDAEKTARADVEVARDKLARVEYGRTMQVAHQEWRDNNILATLALLDGTQKKMRGWEWKYVDRLCHNELLGYVGEPSSGAQT